LKHIQLDLIAAGIPAAKQSAAKPEKQPKPAPPPGPQEPVRFKEYTGAIHIHTTYSDGDGSFNEVVEAATGCGLDYVILSDHDTLECRRDGREGRHDGVLFLAEQEVSPRDGHCLVIGSDLLIEVKRSDKVDRIFEQLQEKGGSGFAAHPFCDRHGFGHIKYITWDSVDDARLTGIELWSYMIDWTRDLNKFNLKELKRRINNPERFIRGPHQKLVKQWDEITRKRRMAAIGSLDAHARRYFFGKVTVFPYRFLFKTIRTHILAEPFENDLAADRRRIYEALIEGRCFIAYDYLAPAKGFSFRCFFNDNVWEMGQELQYKPGMLLKASSPHAAELYLIRDGTVIGKQSGEQIETRLKSPGVYRVEAKIEGQPWVYTNPIYIRENLK